MSSNTLNRYRHVITDDAPITVQLTAEQRAAVLCAYDDGIHNLSAANLAALEAVLAALKDQIHP